MGVPDYWPDTGWKEGLGEQERTAHLSALVPRAEYYHGWDYYLELMQELDTSTKFYTCDLQPESDPAQVITKYIGAAVQASPYKTAKFESARLSEKDQKVHASTVGKFLFTNTERPEFADGTYSVSRIKVIYNPGRWEKYIAYMTQHKPGLDALGAVAWVTPTVSQNGFSFPIIDATRGECYLVHGTKEQTIKLIAQNGFGPEYCNDRGKFQGGYGSLGQGSYLSDNLAKCATYASCPKCKTSGGPCDCGDESGPLERMAIIARAFIPENTKVTTKKDYSYSGQSLEHKKERPMVIGLSNKQGSKWPNNVFLVRHKDMVYPEFIIFFQWPRAGFWKKNPFYEDHAWSGKNPLYEPPNPKDKGPKVT